LKLGVFLIKLVQYRCSLTFAKRAALKTSIFWLPNMNLQLTLPAKSNLPRVANQSKIIATAIYRWYAILCAPRAMAITALCASLVMLSGCSFFGKTPEGAPVTVPVAASIPMKPTAITPVAQNALAQARSHVTQAAERAALWPSAAQLLKQAEAAALQFDSPLTIKLADEVSALCVASVKQSGYPPLSWQ
jgi:hypothetical protein